MAKKATGSQEEPAGKITTAKVRAELLRKANMVVLHKQKADPSFTLFEYFDRVLSRQIADDYAAMIREEGKK
jgi:hypothetical protein